MGYAVERVVVLHLFDGLLGEYPLREEAAPGEILVEAALLELYVSGHPVDYLVLCSVDVYRIQLMGYYMVFMLFMLPIKLLEHPVRIFYVVVARYDVVVWIFPCCVDELVEGTPFGWTLLYDDSAIVFGKAFKLQKFLI